MNEIKNYAGLEYVTLKTDKSAVPAKTLIEIERKIVEIILKERPIRGRELQFLRKQLMLSCAKLSVAINGALSTSTITLLEKKKDERLSPVNEVFFRTFFLEKFNIQVNIESKILIPDDIKGGIELAA